MTDDLEARIDALYAVPLGDFVDERNALARALRDAGDRSAAERVKALKKPPVTAWAVNQLFHHYGDVWNGLMDATEAIREAHARGPDRLAPAMAARKEALREAIRAAEGILGRAGGAVGPTQSRRLSATLEALAAGTEEGVAGRLTADLEPPGFLGLAGLQLAPGAAPLPRAGTGTTGRSPSTATPAGARKKDARPDEPDVAPPDPRLAAARDAVRSAESALATADAEARDAEAALQQARRQAEEGARAADAAREAYDRAKKRLTEADAARAGLERRVRKAEQAVDAAGDATTAAARALEKARAALGALEGSSS